MDMLRPRLGPKCRNARSCSVRGAFVVRGHDDAAGYLVVGAGLVVRVQFALARSKHPVATTAATTGTRD